MSTQIKQNSKRIISSVQSLTGLVVGVMTECSQPEDWIQPDTPKMLVAIPIPAQAQSALKDFYNGLEIAKEAPMTQGDMETIVFARLISLGMLSIMMSQNKIVMP